jgi:Tfp pilus assembly protein PilN
VARQNRKIALLREQIAPIEATAVSVSEKRDQLAVLNAHLAGRELPLVVLLELYRVTPQGINLVELQVGENNVAITGQARSADLAYAYPSTLMKSDVFSRVHFRGAHPVRRGDGAVTQFSCECRAELPEDAAGGGR